MQLNPYLHLDRLYEAATEFHATVPGGEIVAMIRYEGA
jgi:hypothetical protein